MKTNIPAEYNASISLFRVFAFRTHGWFFVLFVLFVLQLLTPSSTADEWPQWMGPDRDNVWKEDGLVNDFGTGQPKILWRAPVAGGYAGPAVVGGDVFVLDYVTSDNVKVPNFDRKQFTGIERILCLDEATGKLKWKHEYKVNYGISYPAGPRCTPNVDGDLVYALGAEGNLHCLQAKTGQVVWSKELKAEYQTKSALWGYSSHPLIDGNKLILLAGTKGNHVVALNKLTGEEIWRSQSATEQGYSPPTMIDAGGTRQLVIASPSSVSALDPETGKAFWSVPYQATNGSIIMSPVRSDDYLFVGGYSNKKLMMELAKDRPDVEVLWQDEPDIGISPVNVQPIVVGDTLFGCNQDGKLIAVKFPSGERLWSTTKATNDRPGGTDSAFIVRQADSDRFWLFNENGDLIIAKMSPDGYDEISRAKVIEPTNVAFGRDVVWCMPAFAHRKMFVRNDKECICVDLSADGNS